MTSYKFSESEKENLFGIQKKVFEEGMNKLAVRLKPERDEAEKFL